MDQAVQTTIQSVLDRVLDPGLRAQISEIFRLAIASLAGLASLDSSLHAQFLGLGLANKISSWDSTESPEYRALLRQAHSGAFASLHTLVDLLAVSVLVEEEAPPSSAPFSVKFAADFDLGSGWAARRPSSPPSRRPRSGPTLPSASDKEIDQAVGLAASQKNVDAGMLVVAYLRDASVLARVLTKEFQTANARIASCFERGTIEGIIRELDTSRESLTEGLFALLFMTFRDFLGEQAHLERSELLPGYKDALERSLVVRRGLANLRRAVTSENDWIIQDKSLGERVRWEAIVSVAEHLSEFMDGEAYSFTRAPDCVELQRFLARVCTGRYTEASRACEGLSRYLESLSVVNQREVLMLHDQEVLAALRGSLEAARSLSSVSLSRAAAQIRQALKQADRLYGRSTPFDEQISTWTQDTALLESPEGLNNVIDTFLRMLR